MKTIKKLAVGTAVGIAAGVAVGTATIAAGVVTVKKIVKEIKTDIGEERFASPDGNHTVTVSYGASKTARGLAYIKVLATADGKDDSCKLIVFSKKKGEFLCGEWSDNDHFSLLIGSGRRKQCCDVSFDGDEIVAQYYLKKINL